MFVSYGESSIHNTLPWGHLAADTASQASIVASTRRHLSMLLDGEGSTTLVYILVQTSVKT